MNTGSPHCLRRHLRAPMTEVQRSIRRIANQYLESSPSTECLASLLPRGQAMRPQPVPERVVAHSRQLRELAGRQTAALKLFDKQRTPLPRCANPSQLVLLQYQGCFVHKRGMLSHPTFHIPSLSHGTWFDGYNQYLESSPSTKCMASYRVDYF